MSGTRLRHGGMIEESITDVPDIRTTDNRTASVRTAWLSGNVDVFRES